MKSNSMGVLTSELTSKGFLFNTMRDRDIDGESKKLFIKLIQKLPRILVKDSKTYRARVVDEEHDVDTGKGITRIGDYLYGGFDKKNSGIAPCEFCSLGRLNREREQVFYLAEEKETALFEQKIENGWISVAEFSINSSIRLIDFSAYTHEEQHQIVSDDFENSFFEETQLSARQLYYNVQVFLTILDSSESYYKTSNALIDLVKEEKDVDGIRYRSYCNGHNIGIWKYEPDDYIFCGSRIVKV